MYHLKRLLFYYSLFALLSIWSCRLNTEALTAVDTLAQDVPNIVIRSVTYKEKENNQLTREVYAKEFRVFSKEDLVQVEQGRVTTYDNDGIERLSGSAEAAEYNRESEDANVTGPIEIYYYPEKTRIRAQQLDWLSEQRLLTSGENALVEVEQDNGTQFEGRNFSVDMVTKTVSYQKTVKGELYAEADEAEANEAEGNENVSSQAQASQAQAGQAQADQAQADQAQPTANDTESPLIGTVSESSETQDIIFSTIIQRSYDAS